jgi:NADPH:quinone reductase-like Zn-dependent oxidoreductase
MRAYGFTDVGGPEMQAFIDVPPPQPGPGELLVQVRAAGVNPGDWRVRQGSYGHRGPTVLGREVAGTVIAMGPEVSGFDIRDEVFGGCPGMVGGWAEQALVTASFAAKRPDGLAAVAAAALPVAAGTAFDAVRRFGLGRGSTLLINGAGGGVGIPATQLAKSEGLRVIGIASPAKHELLARFGAIPVAYGAGVVERVREAAPNGIDAILDMVGGEALRTVAGLLDDRSQLTSVADKALAVELGGFELIRDRSTAVLAELARLAVAGRLDPHVTEVMPLAEAPAALFLVERGHSTGKVVIVP